VYQIILLAHTSVYLHVQDARMLCKESSNFMVTRPIYQGTMSHIVLSYVRFPHVESLINVQLALFLLPPYTLEVGLYTKVETIQG
jgi:hypothetical protein